MMRPKRLRSVAHSVGHHGVSGLCHVHPHLGQACQAEATLQGEIELLTGRVTKPGNVTLAPLILASGALSQRFIEILESEEMGPGELSEATILFVFKDSIWPSSCYVRIESVDGFVAEAAVGVGGGRAEVLRSSEDRGQN